MRMRRPVRAYGTTLSIMVLAVVAVLLLSVVMLVRVKLLRNTQDMGMALVQAYALEEEMNLTALKKTALLASQFVDEISSGGGDSADIQAWLAGYLSKLTEIIGEGVVDPYAVIDGKIVAAVPWEGDTDYPFEDTQWYQRAIQANGDVAYTDVYEDAITGQRILTISKQLNDSGDVFAMDIYVENRALHNTAHTLPQDCSYYLCDQDGNLLYSSVKWESDEAELQAYADYFMGRIRDGSLEAYDASFEDLDGVSRGAYYQEMDNGWTVIMTIPINSILMGDKNIVVLCIAGAGLLLFGMLAFMTIRDMVKSRRMKRADDTAHLLGDSFYAIFSVNIKTGTYEAFKRSYDMQEGLPRCGDYPQLLQAIKEVVPSETYRTFEASFSLEQIRERVNQGVADYGGDYQRLMDGTYQWVNIRTLYNPKLLPHEVILCFRNVDAEKRRELQNTLILQEALNEAEKSTRAKSEFFSRMSHDMRTPLNAILGCCGLAEKHHMAGDTGKVWDDIKKIEFAGGQLLELINDILELSRMEAGKNRLEEKQLDLKNLITSIANMFSDCAQEAGKRFSVSLDLQETQVMGDEKKLSQILNNLLSNALKYSRPGDEIRLEVRQFNFQEHSKYQLVVEDTGIGMSPSFLKHLFEPYSRETTFSSQSATGTGLGMAIVKSLVQQMSGEISVESTLGKGSRFTVTIPLKTAGRSREAERSRPEHAQSSFDWAGRHILVAEDNELNREILTELLETLGAEVLPAASGREAVRLFAAAPEYTIDAILMDIQMPEMDGCQAASAIRAMDRSDAGWVPIIAVTANAFAEDIDRTTAAGMNAHVSKPIDVSVLSEIMQKLTQERGEAPRMRQ